jgi:carbon-monoxide dehydrogenase large subunit
MPDSAEVEHRLIPGSGRRRIGEPVQRAEDGRFVRGAGCYTDDLDRLGQLYAAFVRAPVAHGRIRAIETEPAAAMPGIVAVLTGADYAADGHGPIVHRAIEGDPADWRTPAFGAGDAAAHEIPQWPMPADKVRHVGEPVALVVAESRSAAIDAAERVAVDIDALPATVGMDATRPAGGIPLHDSASDDVAVAARRGDEAATAAALAQCDLVVSGTFDIPRLAGGQMEPRAAIAEYDPAGGRWTVTAGTQGPHRYRMMIAGALGVPPEQVRVVCPDTGGGFGPRAPTNPEYALIAWAAKRLGRPVKWTGARTEAFVSDWQGRDMRVSGTLGVMRDGTVRAYRVHVDADIGAYAICYAPLANASRLASTVYAIDSVALEIAGRFTNTLPVLPFRGAGRPEVHYAIERLVDKAAQALGRDRLELRRQNLVPREAMPWTSPLGLTYEECAFAEALDDVAARIGWAGFETRRAGAAARGRLRGIAVSPFIESPVGAPFETVRVEIAADGRATIRAGTQNHGQGHETSYAQVVSDRLGIPFERIALAGGDTDAVALGGGTHSDRSMRMAGTLLVDCARQLVETARPTAAELLQADNDSVTFEDGAFRVANGTQSVGFAEIAAALGPGDNGGPALTAEAKKEGRINTFPYGAAAAEIEIDPDTGTLDIVALAVAHDCGTPVNPAIVHGQTHGGLVQGVGQAIGEAIVYDRDSGQLLSGSFMDYMMPRADQFPGFSVTFVSAPTASDANPLGVRAGGEGGCIPALAIVGNAVHDALIGAGRNPDEIAMPFTAPAIWQALQEAPKPA